jgi:hypothetical protein
LEHLGADGRIILKCILKKPVGRAWTGLIWLRIGTGGGILRPLKWIIGFHKTWGISSLTEELGICSWAVLRGVGLDIR